VLLIPGIGTVDELRMAADCGARTVRVATHCTEADISEQHIGLGRKLGLDTVGFLMMSHMASARDDRRRTKLMESYGANCVYVTDSAGYMLPEDVSSRIVCVRDGLDTKTEIGFHAITTSAWASRTRSRRSRPALAASTARRPGSARAPVTRRSRCSRGVRPHGIETGVDLFKLMDVAEDRVVPLRINRCASTESRSCSAGRASIRRSCSSPRRAEERYGVPARDVLVELGRRGTSADKKHDRERAARARGEARSRAHREAERVENRRPSEERSRKAASTARGLRVSIKGERHEPVAGFSRSGDSLRRYAELRQDPHRRGGTRPRAAPLPTRDRRAHGGLREERGPVVRPISHDRLRLPGHGLSAKKPFDSPHVLVDHLRELLDALGLAAANLSGESLGGWTTGFSPASTPTA